MVKLRFVSRRMMTGEGRRLAEKRNKFMVRFFDRLNLETEGKI
jgi:HD superfamily phosphodiesterase